MAVVCDTGGIYALFDADDAHHASVKNALDAEPGPLLLPVVLIAEIDYVLQTRLGIDAAIDFAESIAIGAFTVCNFTAEDATRCLQLVRQYRDLELGMADAFVVATAERFRLQRILSLDQRHFRAIRPLHVDHFHLVPADDS